MWHDEPEVVRFLERVRTTCPDPRFVVELGSYAMHDHDPRPLWPGVSYVGVDNRDGPGVELRCLAHEAPATLRRDSWDLVLSVSALEHDPYWRMTVGAAVALANPEGGVIGITCAGPGWGAHELDCAPEPDHYENVGTQEILDELFERTRLYGGKVLAGVTSWYEQRTVMPHWPRTCVIATIGRV